MVSQHVGLIPLALFEFRSDELCERVDALAALTRFRVELGHLEGPLQLCERCSPDVLATYWTRGLKEHLVAE